MGWWSLLAVVDGFEYWSPDDGLDSKYADVYRRRVSSYNFEANNGEPVGARWECKRWWFDRYVNVDGKAA